jgi:hypothetical protein
MTSVNDFLQVRFKTNLNQMSIGKRRFILEAEYVEDVLIVKVDAA